MTSPINRLIGRLTCRVFARNVEYHAWPVIPKRGAACECGKLRIARIRRNGEIVSEAAADRATSKEQP